MDWKKRSAEEKVFGPAYRTHPVTKMPLEDGSGALPDDLQALNLHIPFIRRTKGDVEADVMLIELRKHSEGNYKAELARVKSERGEA